MPVRLIQWSLNNRLLVVVVSLLLGVWVEIDDDVQVRVARAAVQGKVNTAPDADDSDDDTDSSDDEPDASGDEATDDSGDDADDS